MIVHVKSPYFKANSVYELKINSHFLQKNVCVVYLKPLLFDALMSTLMSGVHPCK